MKEKIKIMLADPDQPFRDYVAALLQTDSDFEVTSQVATNAELFERLKLKEAGIVLFNDKIFTSGESIENTKLFFSYANFISLQSDCQLGELFTSIREAKYGAGAAGY